MVSSSIMFDGGIDLAKDLAALTKYFISKKFGVLYDSTIVLAFGVI